MELPFGILNIVTTYIPLGELVELHGVPCDNFLHRIMEQGFPGIHVSFTHLPSNYNVNIIVPKQRDAIIAMLLLGCIPGWIDPPDLFTAIRELPQQIRRRVYRVAIKAIRSSEKYYYSFFASAVDLEINDSFTLLLLYNEAQGVTNTTGIGLHVAFFPPTLLRSNREFYMYIQNTVAVFISDIKYAIGCDFSADEISTLLESLYYEELEELPWFLDNFPNIPSPIRTVITTYIRTHEVNLQNGFIQPIIEMDA